MNRTSPTRGEPTRLEEIYQGVAIVFHELLLRLVPAALLMVVIRLGSGGLEKLGIQSTDFLLALLVTTLTVNGISGDSGTPEEGRK